MDRRKFLYSTLMTLGSAPLASCINADVRFASNPFTLGIASGDITPSTAVLWTRLAPTPAMANGGMPAKPVAVRWTLATDEGFSQIVQQGEVAAIPALAHSVHVELDDLQPGRQYWYRFSVGKHVSGVGRTRTLPASTAAVDRLRFATASCQNYTHGHFVAYQHMVDDDPDFVIHLGDYIYDTSFGETFRKHETESMPASVDDFRRRHALYKTDPFLQQAHAALPFFFSIDNHDAIEDNAPQKAATRAAAYQAWYEHMPVRGYHRTGANHFDIYRKISVGDLAQICLLDSRQFRDTREICDGPYAPSYGFGNYRQRCEAVFDPERSMLGTEQEAWLAEAIKTNQRRWNVIASPGPFQPFTYQVDQTDLRYIGAWDAYPENRKRVASAIDAAEVGHPIIVSGDVHSFWAMDGARTELPDERFAYVEFVTSAVAANWPPPLAQPVLDNLSRNPQVSFYDPVYRGYMLHEVNREQWATTARAIDDMRDRASGVRSLARFEVGHGTQGFTQTQGAVADR